MLIFTLDFKFPNNLFECLILLRIYRFRHFFTDESSPSYHIKHGLNSFCCLLSDARAAPRFWVNNRNNAAIATRTYGIAFEMFAQVVGCLCFNVFVFKCSREWMCILAKARRSLWDVRERLPHGSGFYGCHFFLVILDSASDIDHFYGFWFEILLPHRLATLAS